LPRCLKWLKESCIDQFDAINCGAAGSFCDDSLATPFFESCAPYLLSSQIASPFTRSSEAKNPYDISRECEGDIADTLCYPVTKYVVKSYPHNSNYQSQQTPQTYFIIPRPTKSPLNAGSGPGRPKELYLLLDRSRTWIHSHLGRISTHPTLCRRSARTRCQGPHLRGQERLDLQPRRK